MDAAPIIVRKRRVIASDGHHGGAWKVAYADFVTAMMAFFLLMWLLNATTEDQRKGLADYFDPAVPISPISGGGKDVFDGDSAWQSDSLAFSNHGGETSKNADESSKKLAEELTERLIDVDNAQQIRVTALPEGVLIDLVDAAGAPLFELGGAAPSALLTDLIGAVMPTIRENDGALVILGHTDSLPFKQGSTYSNWELSADRANVARRIALDLGLEPLRIQSVIAKADRVPFAEDEAAPENRRISFLLSTNEI